MTDEVATLEHELEEARENLALVRERISEFVPSTGLPLQLLRERRKLEQRICSLKRRLDELRPINVLRRATKLIVGPVARALTGAPWKRLRQRLLTQASKLPRAAYLDIVLMEDVLDDLIRLSGEVMTLLGAYRIVSNPGQWDALEQHAGLLAGYLIRIYRLETGGASDLEALVAGEL